MLSLMCPSPTHHHTTLPYLSLLDACEWPPALKALLYPGHFVLLLQVLVLERQAATVGVRHHLNSLVQLPHGLGWGAARLLCIQRVRQWWGVANRQTPSQSVSQPDVQCVESVPEPAADTH